MFFFSGRRLQPAPSNKDQLGIIITKKYVASSDPRYGIQFIPSDILCGKSSGILFGILFEIFSGKSSGILIVVSSDILSGISSDILSGILSGRSSGILSGIST